MDEREHIARMVAAIEALDHRALELKRQAEAAEEAASALRVVVALVRKECAALDAEYGCARRPDGASEYGPTLI